MTIQIIQFNTLEEIKAYAKQQLEKTDYAVLPDVKIVNKSEFETYRSRIRDAYLNPYLSFQFFTEPKAIWGDSSSQVEIIQPKTDIPTE